MSTTPNRLEIQRHAQDYWQIVRNRMGLIFLAFLLVFSVAAIITYIMPRKYVGRVEMVIERVQSDARVIGHMGDSLAVSSDSFLKTQFEILSKRKTLDRVVDKLDLVTRWNAPNKAAAAGKLMGNLEPQSSMKSDFITLEYFDEDAKLAADIANTIAESYKETRLALDNERTDKALAQITAQITAKEEQATQALAKVLDIKKRLGIVEMPGSVGRAANQDDVSTPESSSLVDTIKDVSRIQREIRDMTAQIEQLRSVHGDDLIRQAGELRVENETIKKLGPTYQDLLISQKNLGNAGLGPKHPTMKGIADSILQTRGMLLEAAEDYRKNLSFRVETAQKQLTEAERMRDNQKDTSIQAQTDHQEFLAAQREWEILRQDATRLKDTLSQKQIDQQMTKTPVTVYQAAEPGAAPVKPNVRLHLMLGAVVGLLCGLGLAFFLEYLDTSVKSMDEVESIMGVPVLAVIPKGVGVLHRSSGVTPDAEAYRILRTNIEFNRKDMSANCISVVSGSPGEGKSTTMVNLATVCAQAGYTTLIIDADMRRPRQHTFFDVPHNFGLSNYLTGNVPLEEVVVQTQVDNLYLLPSGIMPADCASLLNSQKFTDLIADMKSRFDLVLIDSPPILGVSDASVLSAEADMTLIVVQHRKIPRHILGRVKQAIEQVGGSIVGVALNRVDIRSDSNYSYQTTYYGYYHNTPQQEDAPKGTRQTSSRKQRKAKDAPEPRSQRGTAGGDDVF
ncbi:polysaccharide biosynthesis tyrosine autokinase [Verrucomicrobium sp. BvORR106]|uniref:GumC family protein n=1 Tax=Verrucomicrobium sp. BvORR106 TaxID=1403819 RepID=UPI00056DA465|nr:polysaccharide biosynthesis tyrosine autokinase [Verrucomicrobium sp. BvORR106]